MHTQKLLEFQADRQACAADIGPGGGTGKTQDEPAKMAAPARDGIGLAAASSDSEAIDMARRRAAARAWSPTADSGERGRSSKGPFFIFDRKSQPLNSNRTADISPRVDGKRNTVHPGRYLIYRPPLVSCRRPVAPLAATLDAGNHAGTSSSAPFVRENRVELEKMGSGWLCSAFRLSWSWE